MKNQVSTLLAAVAVAAGLMMTGHGSAQAATDKGERCQRFWIDSDEAYLCKSWTDHGRGDGYYDGEYWVKPGSNRGYVYPAVKIDGVNSYFTVENRHEYEQKRLIQLAMCNLRTCTTFI
ncbi:hypothetical protein AB5J62_12820 [Amycolatopsis sp. cg5]|uniref:hypothetical protein n=1 Tax=Amycolatopsis sp. cg5 TaxID=3238802 RepID=UPI00352378D8